MSVKIITGDCREALKTLPDECVHCVVTSPPYWGLRNYKHAEQLGLESTPEGYVQNLVDVFRKVRRVLRNDGTLWLNLGDSYAANRSYQVVDNKHVDVGNNKASRVPLGLKAKDLVGIPWRVAFALQSDGWYLRQDIIWSKPNPMPESVRDRCTKSHEYIFLLSKRERYYFNAEAIAEPQADISIRRAFSTNNVDRRKDAAEDVYAISGTSQDKTYARMRESIEAGERQNRNKRSVWTVTTKPFKGAHFATFPPDLIEPCILAGSPIEGAVLDPFGGAGTTGVVADRLGRDAILIELNPEYADMAKTRITGESRLFAQVEACVFDRGSE